MILQQLEIVMDLVNMVLEQNLLNVGLGIIVMIIMIVLIVKEKIFLIVVGLSDLT